MTDHEILELLKKPEKPQLEESLSKFKTQVEEILGDAKLLIPASVLDGLVQSFRDSLQSVAETGTRQQLTLLQEILEKLASQEQKTEKDLVLTQIWTAIQKILAYEQEKAETRKVERQVLERIKAELG